MSLDEKPKVLVIDDDPDFLDLYSMQLSPRFEVHIARDGQEGVEMLADITPAVVLLDLSMPRMSGRDVLKYMAARPRLRGLPVIIITGRRLDPSLKALFARMPNVCRAYEKSVAVRRVASEAMKAAFTGELYRSTHDLMAGVKRVERSMADDPRR
ncbi:MAG: response regulator [Elusimicrobiota bacterium]